MRIYIYTLTYTHTHRGRLCVFDVGAQTHRCDTADPQNEPLHTVRACHRGMLHTEVTRRICLYIYTFQVCIFVCLHMFIGVYAYICVFICILYSGTSHTLCAVCERTCMSVCVLVCICTKTQAHMHTHTHVYINTHAHTHTRIYTHAHTYA